MRVLSSAEENEVLNRVKKLARDTCKVEIQGFIDCEKGKTFSVIWSCRSQFNEMNSCTQKFFSTNPKFVDKARIEYIKEKRETKLPN